MNDDDTRPPQVRMGAEASGQAKVYQVGQGNLTVHHHSDRATGPAAVVVPVVALHDPDGSGFVGRHDQIDLLLDALDPTGRGPVATVVSAVAGMGGVGKTALAEHVASLAVGRGWFPGGAVLVDLHGYTEGRVEAGQVFAPMLRAFGLDSTQMPAEVDEQTAVYHHLLASLAEAGRPVLVVLDNASATDQVGPLLPRQPAHRAVVTSRHIFGDLDGVRVLNLDMLSEGEAVALLDRALRERGPVDRRVAGNPGGAVELVRLCGLLPLAVRIIAAILADDPGMPLADLVAELADAHTRLGVLRYGDRDVTAAFDLSWRHLVERDAAAARVFRLLPVNPGPEISVDAAAALAGDLPPVVRGLLRVLARAHLIERGTATSRWRMHDLVHAYATTLSEDQPRERTSATERLLRHYLATADAGNDHLRALPGQPVPDRFTGRNDALDWFDTEHPNLLAAVTLATDTDDHDTVVRLAAALAGYLSWRRHLTDWVTVATTARDAAQHLGNRHSEGTAWHNLGNALRGVRRFDEAITAHHTAIKIHRETGVRRGEGAAWGNLGNALQEMRRFDEAITAHHTAIDIHRETRDRHGEGLAWNNLGFALIEARRFEEAITVLEHARDIHQQTQDRHSEGATWNNLALALREMERFDEAINAFEHARDISRATGDRHREGVAWNNLSIALQQVGRFKEAITAAGYARDNFRETGDRHGEGMAWNNLGLALAGVRRFNEAITAHHTACDLYQQTQDRHRGGTAWKNLGLALAEMGRFDEAITAFDHARDLCQQIHDRNGEGEAWKKLGLALGVVGRLEEATIALHQAIEAYTETGETETAEAVRRLLKQRHD